MRQDAERVIEIHAHRGGRGVMPENTLAAFAHALAVGVSALELDVGVSADGVVVVHHDRRLNPDIARDLSGQWVTQNGPSVFGLRFAELGAFDVGRLKPDTAYALEFPHQRAVDGQAIPCLEQVVDFLHRCGAERVGLNVELKLSPLEPDATLEQEQFVQRVVEVLQSTDVTSRSAIQSFDWRPLQYVQRAAPAIATGYLSCQQPFFDTLGPDPAVASLWHAGYRLCDHGHSLPAMVKAAGGSYWCPCFRDLDGQQLAEAHALGLGVKVWTVNEIEDARRLVAMGVDALITDYPGRMRELFLELGLPVADPVPVTT